MNYSGRAGGFNAVRITKWRDVASRARHARRSCIRCITRPLSGWHPTASFARSGRCFVASGRRSGSSHVRQQRRPRSPADFHRPGSAAVPQPGPAGQARSRRHQADGDAARSVARLFARRRRAGAGDRRGREQGLRLHDQGQFRRRHHQRHRHPRPRQSRRARRQAGDGRQGGAVQALRRHRFHRSRSLDRGSRRDHQLREAARQELGRHQSRGHQGAGVLHHRAAAARAARHPGVPRRPARHRDHRRRRPAQRARSHRPRHQDHQARLQRRRRRRHRLPRTAQGDRLRAGEPDPLRHQGRDLRGPHRRHEPVEVGLCGQDQGAHAGRRASRAPTCSSACRSRAR